ncbi:MAG: helicase-related protein, partial [Mariprofundaceae bacterium]|nr:helicase-related protein [Mariprofundaceae bacterium]
VCAAEALSFVASQSDDCTAKRLRLTLGTGHGIATFLDQAHQDNKEDKEQIKNDSISENNTEPDSQKPLDEKRQLRVEWWKNVLIQPFSQKDGEKNDFALFEHPAILAASKEIEDVCKKGEKVLVFGRFTRPLRALVQLLNAREMLRRIDKKELWPQSKFCEKDNWNAVLAAHRQLQRQGVLDKESLNETLAKQYQTFENHRQNIQKTLIASIEKEFKEKEPDQRVRAIFNEFKNHDKDVLKPMVKAMQSLMGMNFKNAQSKDFVQIFIDIIMAATDHEEGDTDGNGSLNKKEASALWVAFKTKLIEEYSHTEGGFSRLMNGETEASTRQLLQLSFNRKEGHPSVLVAQSLVGREGLNLHKACRTVVLLHPEWNPGIVEQQIGRIDRIGSLWEEKLYQATKAGKPNDHIPRIEIRPVIFKGTYDEKNWQILHHRWDDLRAQLHGIVIPPLIAKDYSKDLINEINNAAPKFSPPKFRP